MGRRLLIIDDDPHICESLRDRLEAMGYTVIVVHDGRTGLAVMAMEAKHDPIRGVLLDVQMPAMSGLDVLRELRVDFKDVPVMMMSAGGDRRILHDALLMGASHYLVKPFDATSLTSICNAIFPLNDHAGDLLIP